MAHEKSREMNPILKKNSEKIGRKRNVHGSGVIKLERGGKKKHGRKKKKGITKKG